MCVCRCKHFAKYFVEHSATATSGVTFSTSHLMNALEDAGACAPRVAVVVGRGTRRPATECFINFASEYTPNLCATYSQTNRELAESYSHLNDIRLLGSGFFSRSFLSGPILYRSLDVYKQPAHCKLYFTRHSLSKWDRKVR